MKNEGIMKKVINNFRCLELIEKLAKHDYHTGTCFGNDFRENDLFSFFSKNYDFSEVTLTKSQIEDEYRGWIDYLKE